MQRSPEGAEVSKQSTISIIAGIVLLVGAPVTWFAAQPNDTVGEPPLPATAAEQPHVPDVVDPPTQRVPRETPDSTDPMAPAPSAPVGIRIPAIGVDAAVDPVGLDADGGMEIPYDIARIGWYEPGVAVGADNGTSVLSGHVDSREQGEGAFFELRALDVDDLVSVDHADGSSSQWRVVARTVYPKDELPIAEIFTRFGDPRLVLITCGGAFDNTERSYDDNVVVYTEPVDPQR